MSSFKKNTLLFVIIGTFSLVHFTCARQFFEPFVNEAGQLFFIPNDTQVAIKSDLKKCVYNEKVNNFTLDEMWNNEQEAKQACAQALEAIEKNDYEKFVAQIEKIKPYLYQNKSAINTEITDYIQEQMTTLDTYEEKKKNQKYIVRGVNLKQLLGIPMGVAIISFLWSLVWLKIKISGQLEDRILTDIDLGYTLASVAAIATTVGLFGLPKQLQKVFTWAQRKKTCIKKRRAFLKKVEAFLVEQQAQKTPIG